MHYDITYCCGHKGQVSLYGKHVDRERKIAWMEANKLCPDCWKIECEKRNRENGIFITLGYCYSANDNAEYVPHIYIGAFGDTYNNKEILKEMGFFFARNGGSICFPNVFNESNSWAIELKGSEIDDLQGTVDEIVERIKEKMGKCKFHPWEYHEGIHLVEAYNKRKEFLAEQEIEKENDAKQVEYLDSLGLPELAGTEKQIEFANEIRKSRLLNMLKHGREIDLFIPIERAKFWIESRGKCYDQLVEEVNNKDVPVNKVEWYHVLVPYENITYIGERFLAIDFPNDSELAGREFNFPRSLTRRAPNGPYDVVLIFDNKFNFRTRDSAERKDGKLIKRGEERESVDAEVVANAFIDITDSFRVSSAFPYEEPDEKIIHRPERKEPVNIEADENLKR